MTLEIERLLDKTGWRLLNELQQNARLSYTELGQRVGLSLPAVTDRIISSRPERCHPGASASAVKHDSTRSKSRLSTP